MKNELEEKLIKSYKTIYNRGNGIPEWAVRKVKASDENDFVHCSIPFVGKEYHSQEVKILVYASAENLSDYYLTDQNDLHNLQNMHGGVLENDEKAIDRHRFFFEQSKNASFFPNVHIQPINNGYLSTAVFYIASKLIGIKDFLKPKQFYEMIAFANYGKFSVETERQKNIRTKIGNIGKSINTDYAGNRKKLSASHEYLSVDAEVLNPDYVIIPQTIYKADKEFIDKHFPKAKIIPIYQINSTVINCWIVGRRKFPRYNFSNSEKNIQSWFEKLNNGNPPNNYLSVFSYLNNINYY